MKKVFYTLILAAVCFDTVSQQLVSRPRKSRMEFYIGEGITIEEYKTDVSLFRAETNQKLGEHFSLGVGSGLNMYDFDYKYLPMSLIANIYYNSKAEASFLRFHYEKEYAISSSKELEHMWNIGAGIGYPIILGDKTVLIINLIFKKQFVKSYTAQYAVIKLGIGINDFNRDK